MVLELEWVNGYQDKTLMDSEDQSIFSQLLLLVNLQRDQQLDAQPGVLEEEWEYFNACRYSHHHCKNKTKTKTHTAAKFFYWPVACKIPILTTTTKRKEIPCLLRSYIIVWFWTTHFGKCFSTNVVAIPRLWLGYTNSTLIENNVYRCLSSTRKHTSESAFITDLLHTCNGKLSHHPM